MPDEPGSDELLGKDAVLAEAKAVEGEEKELADEDALTAQTETPPGDDPPEEGDELDPDAPPDGEPHPEYDPLPGPGPGD